MIYTLLLYSLDPYRWTGRQTDGETNTLASRGLEEPFSSCAVVLCQFLVLAGNAGTRYTLFSGGLFWDQAGNSFWCYVRT